MKERKRGVNIVQEIDRHQTEQLKQLEELSIRIDSELKERLIASREEIKALTARIAAEMNDQALIAAHPDKLYLLDQLSKIQASLLETLPEMKKNLEEEKNDKSELRSKLEDFREKLKYASALNCSGTFHKISERGSYRIVTGKQPTELPKPYDTNPTSPQPPK